MKWKVGESYKLQNGDEVRVLAIDVPPIPAVQVGSYTPYPILTMCLKTGAVHYHQANGHNYMPHLNLMPPMRHVEGFIGVILTCGGVNGSCLGRTTFIYSSKEEVASVIRYQSDWHIIPVSFDIEEE